MLEHKWRNPFVEGRDGERVEYHHKATAGTERKGGFKVNDPLSARLAGAGGWGIALIRVMVGIVFLVHGVQKLFLQGFGGVAGFFGQMGVPLPLLFAVIVTLLEFFGGLALILGLFTRWVSIPFAIEMLVATLLVHLPNGFFAMDGGYEFPLLLVVASVGLLLSGSGALSVDSILEIERRHGQRRTASRRS